MGVPTRRVLWAVVVAALLGCGPAGDLDSSTPVDLHGLLPDPSSVAGWNIVEGPVELGPETLFEYLDGGAERYLTHGFRRLVQVSFGPDADGPARVTLDVYDMGGELGAFGIYSSARPTAADFKEWGVEGYRSGTVAAAWKGRVYTHAEADDDRPESIAMLEWVVAHVCAALPGDASQPAILRRLPIEGLIPRSERYVAEDLLGHVFLPGGVLAGYGTEGGDAEVFFSDLGKEAAAAAALAKLRAHYSQRGEVLGEMASIGAGGFRFRAAGLGSGTVVRAGPFVAGVYGDLSVEVRERLLARLVASLW